MAITQRDSEKELNHDCGFMKRHPEFFSSSDSDREREKDTDRQNCKDLLWRSKGPSCGACLCHTVCGSLL